MTKTALTLLIEILKDKNVLDMNEAINIINNLKPLERTQITDSFDEGVKYGNGLLQTFDYPTSRYFGFTFTQKND